MKRFILSISTVVFTTLLLAQEGETKNVNIDITSNGDSAAWYTSPWVWVVGAAVFILLRI